MSTTDSLEHVDPLVVVETLPTTPGEIKGAFMKNLVRNNKKIRDDRAVAIGEAAQLLYRRKVEDTLLDLKQLRREREALIDLSPTTADSLILASDFNAEAFVKRDIDLGVKIRNTEITLEIAQRQYHQLFEA
jgi:hypothetical protein